MSAREYFRRRFYICTHIMGVLVQSLHKESTNFSGNIFHSDDVHIDMS